MKHIYIWITCMILPLVFFTGCDEDAVDPLTGKYPIPETYALTKLVGQSTAKNESGTRTFTLLLGMEGSSATYNEATDGFTAGSGQFLAVAFVGKDYFLESGTYSIAERASAKAGNYIAAYNDSGIDKGTYWHNSSSMAAVVSGNLSVKQSGNTYTISGTTTLADNSVIRISFEGTILYEADPEPPAPMALTNVFAVSAQPQEAGHQLITLKIATAGVSATFNPATYGYDFEGNGNYISIDFLSNNANLDPGIYTSANNEAATVGNFVKGYDTEMWGMSFYNWGSCWFEISDGTEIGQHLTDGNITVSKSGNQYIITIETSVSDGSSIFAQYTGTIEGLGDGEEEPGEDYTYTLAESEVSSYDWMTGETTVYEGVTMNTITVSDAEGNIAAVFEAITTTGEGISGTYSVVDGPTAAGQMNNGWSIPDFGMEGGSYYMKDGVKWFIKSGSVIIAEAGGSLSFSATGLGIADSAGNVSESDLVIENCYP